jgi:LysR family hydrogen peroxide-inducible transcriptional activator
MARRCLQDLATLAETARAENLPLHGPLHLGVIPTIAPFLLPSVLPPLRKAYPELRLYLHEDITQRLYERLMDGTLDVVLLALPYDFRDVEQVTLYRDRFRLAAHARTKLIDPQRYDVGRLKVGSVLLLQEVHCLRHHAIDACNVRDRDKISNFSASSLLTLIEMVDADLGVTFLPEMAVGSAMLQGTEVRTYELGPRNYREIGLMWRRGSARAEEFRRLGEFLAERRIASA